MTIKKVRILDVHPSCPWFDIKDRVVGKVCTLDIEEEEYVEGWSAAMVHWDKMSEGSLDFCDFYAIRIEEVEE